MLREELIQSCKNDLLKEKDKIETWLAQHPSSFSSEGFEKGSGISLQEMNRYNHNVARERLADITASLERIDNGIFGVCPDCGKEIPEERLIVYPYAKRCVPCQQLKKKNSI